MSRKLPTETRRVTRESISSKNKYGFHSRHPDLNIMFDNPFANYFKHKLTYKNKSVTFSAGSASIDIEDNKITINFPLTTKQQKERSWVTGNYNYNIPYDANHITMSVEDFLEHATIKLMGITNWNEFCDQIRVGDFVQFTGQRDTGSWRKIISIDWDRNSIFGHKYRAPIDENKYDCRDSSSNMITTIKSWSHVQCN